MNAQQLNKIVRSLISQYGVQKTREYLYTGEYPMELKVCALSCVEAYEKCIEEAMIADAEVADVYDSMAS
jgi:hypothetical protein